MMNIYKLLKLASCGKIPPFVKLLGLWAMHITGRRYIGIFFDPVLACNLRCRMCYFSNESRRKELSGVITSRQLDDVERTFLQEHEEPESLTPFWSPTDSCLLPDM